MTLQCVKRILGAPTPTFWFGIFVSILASELLKHRYLRKVDCSSRLHKIHVGEQALVVGVCGCVGVFIIDLDGKNSLKYFCLLLEFSKDSEKF